jgi:serine/threonine protein kinase
MDLGRAGRLLAYCCHALDAAHEAGIIHRDLKPANLMVANAGTVKESVKVMDFGFAGFATKPHLQLSALTGKGGIHAMGTPEYISPEMVRGDRVDGRCDIYSLGVILFEMLTGRLPFEDSDLERLLTAQAQKDPPRFAELRVYGIPAEVEAVVRLALSKYPIERQQRARDLAKMYGDAVGEDFWTATAPEGWEPTLPIADPFTPPPRTAPNLPLDPYQISHEFNSFLPEGLVAAKIRGFVDDLQCEVLASEPGIIRMRYGAPSTHQEAPATGSTILNWFRTVRKPQIISGQEPIELELTLKKPHPGQARLHVVVACRPMKQYPPTCPRTWRSRCDKINTMLRQYLGA